MVMTRLPNYWIMEDQLGVTLIIIRFLINLEKFNPFCPNITFLPWLTLFSGSQLACNKFCKLVLHYIFRGSFREPLQGLLVEGKDRKHK